MIFDPVLNQLVSEVASALGQPKEKISVEMVFCSLYYVAKAVIRALYPDVVTYLVERAKLFGLIKAGRKRHRQKDALYRQIWDPIPLIWHQCSLSRSYIGCGLLNKTAL